MNALRIALVLSLSWTAVRAQPKPEMGEFMRLNGHYHFKPELYAQVCRHVRNYHNVSWDMGGKFDALPQFPLADPDQDGWNNQTESTAGTDPFDPALKTDWESGEDLDNVFYIAEPRVSPDTDVDPAIRSSFGLENKFNEGTLPRMFNFGLPEDAALGSWTANNLHFKADSLGHSCHYQPIPQWPNLTYKLLR